MAAFNTASALLGERVNEYTLRGRGLFQNGYSEK